MSPTSIADVLHQVTREPGRPRLTWYGEHDERVELSGAVLENWVNKTANLLVEEFDAGPGAHVLIDLPPHWRTIVWALAAWRVGACVQLVAAATSTPDIVVTSRPDDHPDADAVVAVALPPLVRRFPGDLPAGAIDAAAAVMTYGDTLGWVPELSPSDDALASPKGTVPHARLLDEELLREFAPGARVLLAETQGDQEASEEFVLATLATLAADGSVVAVGTTVAAALAAEPSRLERLMASERITAS